MKCEQHGKDLIGTCQWCGKPMCKFDVGKTMGKKSFCKKCAQDLGSYIQNKQLDQIKEENEAAEKRKQYNRMFKF